MKLISEEVSSAEYLVEEDKNGKKEYKIKGVFLQSNIKNRNGRVYPKEILMKEVTRYNKEFWLLFLSGGTFTIFHLIEKSVNLNLEIFGKIIPPQKMHLK